ncbi:alcohol dehydrogenase catalytic domain-containing protein [Sphaerisporangium sp. NPDC004334]
MSRTITLGSSLRPARSRTWQRSRSFPPVLGWDVAGTVSATGAGVHAFAVGDRVFGPPAFPRPPTPTSST